MAGKLGRVIDKRCYDNEKLWEFVNACGKTTAQIADLCGMTEDTVLRYLNKIPSVKINEPTLRMIIVMAGGVYEDFVSDKPVDDVSEVKVAETVSVDCSGDINEIKDLLKELITTINKLGNIEMQNMEYLKELRDLMK